MFSNFFGSSKPPAKKAGKDTAEQVRPAIKEILDMQGLKDDVPSRFSKKNAALNNASTRVNTPLGVDPKALAKAAAARIDAIEKEMSLDLRGGDAHKLGAHPRAQEVAMRASGFVKVALPQGLVPPQPSPQSLDAIGGNNNQFTVMPEIATTLFLGKTTLAKVIDVKESTVAPSVEESAVLYANGQLDEAIEVLKIAFSKPQSLGASEFNAYRTLLDLLRIKGDQATFENVAMDFVLRFEKSPPSWEMREAPLAASDASSIPTIDLGEMLDMSIVPMLEQLKVLAQHSNVLRVDASHIVVANAEDGFGCELLLRVMKAFENANYVLELQGMAQLVAVLKPHLKTSDASTSFHVWLLYLELLRLAGQQNLFEERALDFAITYETSPPSWIAPSPQISLIKPDSRHTTSQVVTNQADRIRLKGNVTGDGSVLINEVANGFQLSTNVVCDCLQLERFEFSAAAKLLTALTYWTAENKVVEFRNLNHPIAALFVTLGIHHLAVVERRRDA